jgi:hypothetical protein
VGDTTTTVVEDGMMTGTATMTVEAEGTGMMRGAGTELVDFLFS